MSSSFLITSLSDRPIFRSQEQPGGNRFNISKAPASVCSSGLRPIVGSVAIGAAASLLASAAFVGFSVGSVAVAVPLALAALTLLVAAVVYGFSSYCFKQLALPPAVAELKDGTNELSSTENETVSAHSEAEVKLEGGESANHLAPGLDSSTSTSSQAEQPTTQQGDETVSQTESEEEEWLSVSNKGEELITIPQDELEKAREELREMHEKAQKVETELRKLGEIDGSIFYPKESFLWRGVEALARLTGEFLEKIDGAPNENSKMDYREFEQKMEGLSSIYGDLKVAEEKLESWKVS